MQTYPTKDAAEKDCETLRRDVHNGPWPHAHPVWDGRQWVIALLGSGRNDQQYFTRGD